ncbi:hypothetical protein QFZ75_000926 [Streptomyces sp. V3I8]|uniref:hypothetical protein n=1 Tax=Streptomyces sp. V3I8 TaxID=3042279 RepID=UPI00278094AE|nr:hypothetical protein [Streptomyces sp. V3I8]MDQ1034510.1 hypothetical protein [Streptomyces sp. V3I8]
MTTPWPSRRTIGRPLAPRVAVPREPVDPARIGRRVVRRRAKGMDAGAIAVALKDTRFDARQASRNEDLADDERGLPGTPAVLRHALTDFAERYTERGRSPAHDHLDALRRT